MSSRRPRRERDTDVDLGARLTVARGDVRRLAKAAAGLDLADVYTPDKGSDPATRTRRSSEQRAALWTRPTRTAGALIAALAKVHKASMTLLDLGMDTPALDDGPGARTLTPHPSMVAMTCVKLDTVLAVLQEQERHDDLNAQERGIVVVACDQLKGCMPASLVVADQPRPLCGQCRERRVEPVRDRPGNRRTCAGCRKQTTRERRTA